jgi:type IV pilus assembly protein PilA
MLSRRALLPLAISLVACAPAPPPPAESPTVTVPRPAAPAPPEPAPTAPSALLAAVPSSAIVVVRIDGRALRAAPIYAQALGAVAAIEVARKRLDDLHALCGINLLETIDEVVYARTGAGETDDVTLAHVRADDAAVLRCAASLLDGKPSTLEGAPAVRFVSGKTPGVAVVTSGVTIIGTEDHVSAALGALRAHASALPEPARGLDLGPAAVVSFAVSGAGYGGVSSGTGVLEMDASHLALRAAIGFLSAEQASAFAAQAHTGIAGASLELGAAPGGAGEALRDYLTRIRIDTDGPRVRGDLTLPGGPEVQAQLMATLSGVAIYAVRRYLAAAKVAEAKNIVSAIARDLAAYMESEDAKGKRPTRFPPSAPPTPPKVPAGDKFTPNASTWSHPTWKAIHLEMTSPLRYSYEIITSKDGRAATVRAHGDLDGNGKQSTIERSVTLNKDGSVTLSPKLVVVDEFE